jgi:acyl-ACP thioesterase
MSKISIALPLVDYQLDCNKRAKAAALCDFLQTAATVHADGLGVSILDLQTRGVTWMLAKMDITFGREAEPHDVLSLETWPAATRAGIVCVRNFRMRNPRGEIVLEATSDWVCVDFASRKLAKLSPELLRLADDDAEQFDFPPIPKPAKGDLVSGGECSVPVRRADLDLNRHVNNVHYIEWLFEPMTDEAYARRLARLAITYHAEAVAGDTVKSSFLETRLPSGETLTSHTLSRGDATLTKATCIWHDRE